MGERGRRCVMQGWGRHRWAYLYEKVKSHCAEWRPQSRAAGAALALVVLLALGAIGFISSGLAGTVTRSGKAGAGKPSPLPPALSADAASVRSLSYGPGVAGHPSQGGQSPYLD